MRSNLKDIHNLYWLHWQGHFQLLRRLWAVLFPPTKYIYIDTLSGQIKQSNIRTFSLSLKVSLFFWLLYFYFKFSLTSLSFRLVSLCSFNELHIGALKFSESFFFFFFTILHCIALLCSENYLGYGYEICKNFISSSFPIINNSTFR